MRSSSRTFTDKVFIDFKKETIGLAFSSGTAANPRPVRIDPVMILKVELFAASEIIFVGIRL